MLILTKKTLNLHPKARIQPAKRATGATHSRKAKIKPKTKQMPNLVNSLRILKRAKPRPPKTKEAHPPKRLYQMQQTSPKPSPLPESQAAKSLKISKSNQLKTI